MARSTTETVESRGGVTQLRRRWLADDPRASLLLVHGIAEHSGRYEHVGEYLADRGIDVLSFDLRGHGESGGRRGHVRMFDEFLDDVEELLAGRRELDVPVVLMGHSLGGLIAAAYVVDERPLPDLLILSSPALSAQVPGWQQTMAGIFALLLPLLPVPSDFDGQLLSRDLDVGTAYRDDPLRVKRTTARVGNEILKRMKVTTASINDVTVPTYVLHGGADEIIPPSATAAFDDNPYATRVVHDGLRHECLNEPEKEEVLAAIVEWLDANLEGDRAQSAPG